MLEGDPLPVELVTFEAEAHGQGAALRWTTASEGNARFEVQRKEEAREAGTWNEGRGSCTTVGQVEGAGTRTEPSRYAYSVDGLSYGTHWFRLRQIGTDGTAHLSREVKALVAPSSGLALEVYPTP